jgi:hypothetical protein
MKKLLLVTAALCSIPASAYADETLKFRTITHAVSVQSQDVGDVDGHVMSVAKFSGLATFPDGTIGTAYFVSATDYIKGSGPASPVYNNLTLDDGSVLWFKTSGDIKVVGNKIDVKGVISVIGGTGRFAGAKGEGVVTGSRPAQLAAGVELYNDITINLKK